MDLETGLKTSSYEFFPVNEMKKVLREVVAQCSERGLYFSAKWAAETLEGLPDEPVDNSEMDISLDSSMIQESTNLDLVEYDKYLLGKSYFDVKEFDRAAYFLESCKSPKCRFLRIYSKYLAGEKRKDEESHDIMGQMNDLKTFNKEIPKLMEEMDSWRNSCEMNDGFLLYIYAVMRKQLYPQDKDLKDLFLESVHSYHYNWSAWVELGECITNRDMLGYVLNRLPNTFMSLFFKLHMSVELQDFPQAFSDIAAEFPSEYADNRFLQTKQALIYYYNRDYDFSETIFDRLLKSDPYRVDDMDIYSNILYVVEGKSAKLSILAHMCVFSDKFRAETMCVLGNYYSSKVEREKAISYFRRALQIDRNCLSAWTLMGHEYLEIKNTHAAVISYKRAVEVNPKDYRAWCALGQIYEMLKLPFYAIYYFQRSSALRPYDARMWLSLASLYEQQCLYVEAIKGFSRALEAKDIDSTSTIYAMTKLAKLYEDYDPDKAAVIWHRLLAKDDLHEDAEERKNGHKYLAHYYKDKGDAEECIRHTDILSDFGVQSKEDARIIVKELEDKLLSSKQS
ncbi:anaphase promoting complex subunit 8 [Glomus cerebriforme]|uniref:Anaphase promoting complex subunit 8 n=1 Tax=Glomus cerebriforme TaxID=658196 RepID=A0A397TLG2_9GLOM|nr:anaphase promoting complex subunit 8 [Glomus cerebriforme]